MRATKGCVAVWEWGRLQIASSKDQSASDGDGKGTTTAGRRTSAWPASLNSDFPPQVLYFGKIWISPTGNLVPIPQRRTKPTTK